MYRSRRADQRDLKIIITSRDSQTGTGKTTLALWLALHFDSWGFDAAKVTLHPQEFVKLYTDNRPGSVIIMDEAEQLDSRRSMSQKNVDFWNLWQTMRYRQITSILTLPTRSALDKRGLELADVWIQVTNRGFARVHKVGVGDYDGRTNPMLLETLSFPDISYLPVKDAVDDKKVQLVEEGEEFVEAEGEVIDPEKIRQEARNDSIKKAYDKTEMTQSDVAEVFGLSQSQVHNIVNS
jgi:predicted XRE-type DNA-binding protein